MPMQVDLNKLRTFYILAGTKSYTRCAEKVYLTQSAVSHAIKKLETELDYELVDRKSRQFKLTRQGEFLYRRCRRIFDQVEDTLDNLSRQKDHPVIINMGAPVEFGSTILIKGMVPFIDNHPEMKIDFVLDPNLLEPLLADELDIIVDCIPHVHKDLVSIELCIEEYVVIASPDYVQKMDIQTIPDLSRCALLSFDKNLFWWRNFINALSEDSGFGYEQIVRITNVRGIINASIKSLGIGFVPRYTVRKELENGTLTAIFQEKPIRNDQINIYLKKYNFEKKFYKDLVSHIKSLNLN